MKKFLFTPTINKFELVGGALSIGLFFGGCTWWALGCIFVVSTISAAGTNALERSGG